MMVGSTEQISVHNRHLMAILDQLESYIFTKDVDGRYTYANNLVCTLFGKPLTEILGKTDENFFQLDRSDDFCRADQAVIRSGKSIAHEERTVIAGSGEIRYFWAVKQPLFDETGQIIGLSGISTDVTALKNTEQALRESEARYTRIMDGTGEGFWEWNMETGQISTSPRFAILLGYAAGEWQPNYDTWIHHVHPDDIAQTLARFDDHLSGKTPDYCAEFRMRTKTGEWRWIQSRGKLADRCPDGRPRLISGTHTDITERRLAEDALRASEEKSRRLASLLRLMCDNVPDMIWAKDLEHRYLFANKAMCEQLLFARDTEEPVGKTDLFFSQRERDSHPDQPDWHTFGELCQDTDALTLRKGEPCVFDEMGRRRGALTCLDVHKAPFLDERGEVIGTVGSARDVTLRKQIEAELEQYRNHLEAVVQERTAALSIAKDEAESANRAKSRFLANMSHELRTPMNGIIGMAHLLARQNTDPGQRDKLEKITRSANHLLQLLEDVLDLSKIEADRLVLDQSTFTIDSLPRAVEALLGDKIRAKGLDFRCQVKKEVLALSVISDPLRIQQILLNLVSNAVKFTETGQITLSVDLEEESATQATLLFSVQDTGIGISQDDVNRIFNPFEQADTSITRKYGGTGLGLPICQRLAGLMGSAITVNSTPGRGSTFSFRLLLPKAPSESSAGQPPALLSGKIAETLLRTHHADAQILMAEDDWVNQEVMLELLVEIIGCQVDIAQNGLQAVEMAEKKAYSLILMDMQMPEMDGLHATREIRRIPGRESVPIIALTANTFVEDHSNCLAAGMDDYITKPVDPDKLFTTLLAWLEKARKESRSLKE